MVRGIWVVLVQALALVAALAIPAQAEGVSLADLQFLAPTEVRIEFSNARTDRRTGARTMLARVTNLTGSTIATPVYLAITRIDPSSVVVRGADGVVTEGSPYYLLNGPFGPGQSLSRDVVFAPTVGPRLPPFTVYPDTYHEGAVNQQPVAVADGNSEGTVGVPVALDGRASHDPDNGPLALIYQWDVLGPTGSTAGLDDAASPTPHFTPDLEGEYRCQLTVFDGKLWSFSDELVVTVVPANGPPNARAGPDLQTRVDTPTTLDGTDSFDPNGDIIAFAWDLFQAPEGSAAALEDATLPNPRVTPDLPGEYQFELVVSDGALFSAPDQATVRADDTIVAPNAHAGDDQNALVGTLATLDGSASNDPNGLSFDYLWTFLDRPIGSGLTDADIALADTAQAQFIPDIAGTFILNLRVDNGFLSDDDTVAVLASESNVAPNADAGPPQAVRISQEAILDGSASIDPDNGPQALSFAWSLVSRPPASTQTSSDIRDATTATARFTPDTEGAYVARLEVSDGAASDADNVEVVADGTPPTIAVTAPGDGAVIQDPRPAITVAFADSGSGIDPDSFQLLINGADVTGAAIASGGGASYTPGADLPFGDNRIVARIADRTANAAEDTINFTIYVFRAIADCGPTTGTPPHTVTYRSRGQFTGGSIVRYRWDRDGNGTYDTSDSVPRDYTYTFAAAGIFNAVLEVQNNFGEIATDTCTINVEQQGPTATASASPSNGPVPLDVALSCQGQSPNGSIMLWEWDFEGDGTYDHSSSTTGNVIHTYTTVGEFGVRCRVTDSAGLTGVSGVINTTVRPRPEGSPSVTATASPTSGPAPLNASLGGSVVAGGAIILYEWDFEGDGTFDYSSPASPSVNHSYAAGGIFGATLRVTDDAGLTSADSIAIEVDVTAGLSIPTDTFEPDIGQSAIVRTTLSGTVQARIVICDNNGNLVRTLVDATRPAGTYDDAWDGRNDAGDLLPDGDYYAVLEYDIGGETRRVDLTDTTGGARYNPSRNTLPSSFEPYNNDPLPITFTVPSNQGAAEILAFVGLFNTDTRLVTLLDREPLGVGTHTIYWDGLLPDGSLAVPPPGDSFLFGIWGYRLPDNAIYIKTAPVLSNIAVSPTQFSPLSLSHPTAMVNFSLDKPATVELTVRNLDTGRILRRISRYVDPNASGSAIYRDDFESGVGLWTHGGSQDEWELGDPSAGPGAAFSGSNAWGTDLDGNYNNNGNAWLLSPPIAVPAEGAALSYQQHFVSESGYDYGYLEISIDNGASFQQLARFNGSLGGWKSQVHSLAAYAGQTARLRFRMYSDCCYNYSGFYIDDFTIKRGDAIGWDGKTDDDLYVAKGDYRLELRATDAAGGVSLVRYALIRVFY